MSENLQTQNPETPKLTSEILNERSAQLRLAQNLPAGVLAGIAAGILLAILWGVITVITSYQIGYMAIGVGAGVGYVIRFFGKGVDPVFGICGGAIALLSCLLGNFLSQIGFIANAEELGYLETLTLFDYSYLPTLMKETFSAIDLLFYGLAVMAAYRLSTIKVDEVK